MVAFGSGELLVSRFFTMDSVWFYLARSQFGRFVESRPCGNSMKLAQAAVMVDAPYALSTRGTG